MNGRQVPGHVFSRERRLDPLSVVLIACLLEFSSLNLPKGILLPSERAILERADADPSPLIVIDCKDSFQLLTCICRLLWFSGLMRDPYLQGCCCC